MKNIIFAIILIPITSCSPSYSDPSFVQCYSGNRLIYQSEASVSHKHNDFIFDDTVLHRIVETNSNCLVTTLL